MKKNYDEIARNILNNIGGYSNTSLVENCMTRVRITIIDNSKVNIDNLKKVDGVMGVLEGEMMQIVVGPGASRKITDAINEIGTNDSQNSEQKSNAQLDRKSRVEKKAKEVKAKKAKKGNAILKSFSSIFVPLIPAFVGAGLISGVAAIISNMLTAGSLTGSFWTEIVNVLNVIYKGIFAYLTIFTGINAAKTYGGTPSLGGVLGGVVLLTGMGIGDEKPPLPVIKIFLMANH